MTVPTVGAALVDRGYDRDMADLDRDVADLPRSGFSRGTVGSAPTWRAIRLDGRTLTAPTGTVVDLGATAKTWTADRCARLVADRLGTGVLLSLGGDIASTGPGPRDGWQVLVQDRPGEPATTIAPHRARSCRPRARMARPCMITKGSGAGGGPVGPRYDAARSAGRPRRRVGAGGSV